jgi:hypothetical protein
MQLVDRSMSDGLSEATVRAALSGLGYDLQWEMGSYVVSDRRATFELPGSVDMVACASLGEVVQMFRLR